MSFLSSEGHWWTFWDHKPVWNCMEIHNKWNCMIIKESWHPRDVWVTKSQNLGPSLFWRALRSRVMDVVHLHQMSRISPLSFHTPHPTHTPTGLTWKIRVQIYHYRNFVHKCENKKNKPRPAPRRPPPQLRSIPLEEASPESFWMLSNRLARSGVLLIWLHHM